MQAHREFHAGRVAFHLPYQLIAMQAGLDERRLFAQAVNGIVEGFVPRALYCQEAMTRETQWRRGVREQSLEEMTQLLLACSLNPMILAGLSLTDARDFREAANRFFDNKALAVKIQVDMVADDMAITRAAGTSPVRWDEDPGLCQEATACLLHCMHGQIRVGDGPSFHAHRDQRFTSSEPSGAFKALAHRLGQQHTAEYALIELLQELPLLTLEEAAAELGCSPRALQRQLHPLGLSFPRVRLAVGLLSSVRLLAQGEPLSQAAVGAGFYDYPHFARVFKRATGMSPQAYQGIVQRVSQPALLRLV